MVIGRRNASPPGCPANASKRKPLTVRSVTHTEFLDMYPLGTDTIDAATSSDELRDAAASAMAQAAEAADQAIHAQRTVQRSA